MPPRAPSAAPTLAEELALIVTALGFGALLGWASPDLNVWRRGEALVHTSALAAARAESAAHRARAEQYARVAAGALNGERITDGERIVACREVR